MKKILFVTRPIAPPWDEASKNFTYFLAKNVKGFEFGLLTNGTISGLPRNVAQKAIYTSNNLTYLQKIRLIRNLRKIKNDFDILHYIFTPTKQNTFLLNHFVNYKKKNNSRTIQTIATLREDMFKDSDFKSILFADLIITYSNYAKDRLNKLGFENVKRVYPGIDLDLYSPGEKDREIQKFLDVADENFVIQYPGEYARLGATDDLVSLIINNADEFRKRKIRICFPGRIKGEEDKKKKAEVRKIFQEKNVLDLVRFDDEIKTDGILREDFMRRRYNTSDLIIFPVRDMKGKFDVPLAVVEAMACGKPVIISDLPLFSEFAKPEHSVIIERGNVAQLKEAILDLYDNPEKRLAIGKSARKFCEDNFDIQKVAEIYRQIYEKL